MAEELYFSEESVEIPVKIKTKDGIERVYHLKEMDGDGLTKWMSMISGRVKRNPKTGMPVGEVDYTQFHASLIALCLWDPETKQRVSKEVISGWKASIQNALFTKCRQINGLDDESAEQVKNG